jgi:hypothetical protein
MMMVADTAESSNLLVGTQKLFAFTCRTYALWQSLQRKSLYQSSNLNLLTLRDPVPTWLVTPAPLSNNRAAHCQCSCLSILDGLNSGSTNTSQHGPWSVTPCKLFVAPQQPALYGTKLLIHHPLLQAGHIACWQALLSAKSHLHCQRAHQT